MAISTKNINKVKDRRSQIVELRKKHKRLFELEGLGAQAKFIPKMAYIPLKGKERIIAFFPSELMGGKDIYTEFVSKQNVPEDPERTLYKWSFNPEYDIEYEKSNPHPATGHIRYYIPVAELINVAEQHTKPEVVEKTKATLKVEQPELPFGMEDDDAPISTLTIRDKAAIDWKKPVSNKPWLNALITKTFKED